MSPHRRNPAHDVPRRRLSGDDGSVIAEMALVAPLLVMLMLGVFEFGTAWRNKTILTNSLRSAGRIESQNSLNTVADRVALGALYAGNSKLTRMTLVKVIVYESTTANGKPPTVGCMDVTVSASGTNVKGTSGVCSVYSPAQVAAAASNSGSFGCTNNTYWDWNFCSGPTKVPTPRNNTFNNGPDYVGVYAEYTYDTLTGLLPGNTMTISDQAVYRIEPAV